MIEERDFGLEYTMEIGEEQTNWMSALWRSNTAARSKMTSNLMVNPQAIRSQLKGIISYIPDITRTVN